MDDVGQITQEDDGRTKRPLENGDEPPAPKLTKPENCAATRASKPEGSYLREIALFVQEVKREWDWIQSRPAANTAVKWNFPSCLGLYGCVPGKPVVPDASSRICVCRDWRPLSTFSADQSPSSPVVQNSAYPRRHCERWTVHPAVVVFGDDIDLKKHPWRVAGSRHLWLVPPCQKSYSSNVAAITKSVESTRYLIGEPEPAHPFYFHGGSFFIPRCRSWYCPEHQAAGMANNSVHNTAAMSERPGDLLHASERSTREERAFASLAWSGLEPLSIPPICSCAEKESRVVPWVQALLRDNITDKFMKETEKELLWDAAACKVCGGLQYFPFSFIEVLLNMKFPTLAHFREIFSLPANTDIICDGPHLSATVVCKSPDHEWQCYQALVSQNPSFVYSPRPPRIYDVCSGSFMPGHNPKLARRPNEKMVTATHPKVNTALNPPLQYFLNCKRVSALHPSDSHSITTVAARRPFCIAVRHYTAPTTESGVWRLPSSSANNYHKASNCSKDLTRRNSAGEHERSRERSTREPREKEHNEREHREREHRREHDKCTNDQEKGHNQQQDNEYCKEGDRRCERNLNGEKSKEQHKPAAEHAHDRKGVESKPPAAEDDEANDIAKAGAQLKEALREQADLEKQLLQIQVDVETIQLECLALEIAGPR